MSIELNEQEERFGAVVCMNSEMKLLEALALSAIVPAETIYHSVDLKEAIDKLIELNKERAIVVVGSHVTINLLGNDHGLNTVARNDFRLREKIMVLINVPRLMSSIFSQAYVMYGEYDLGPYVKSLKAEADRNVTKIISEVSK